MVLTGLGIHNNVQEGTISIEPYHFEHVNPNSYDVLLGNSLIKYVGPTLDTAAENTTVTINIPEEGYVLRKDQFYLGHTLNRIGSDHFIPMLHNKSGIARLGLFIHITSDLVDIGFHGNLTLQLFPTLDVKVYPGMKIAQVSFWVPQGEVKLYSGKYQNARGPLASRSFYDRNK